MGLSLSLSLGNDARGHVGGAHASAGNELIDYASNFSAWYFHSGFLGANILDSSGNNRHALSRNTGSILGDGTMYFAVTGLLTTDTITCASTDQATCSVNGRLAIANGHVVWGITVTRSGETWAFYPCSEIKGLILHDVSGNGRHGLMTTGTDANWQVVDLPTQNYLRDHGGSRVIYLDGVVKMRGTTGYITALSTDNIQIEVYYNLSVAGGGYILGNDAYIKRNSATVLEFRPNGAGTAVQFTFASVPLSGFLVVTHDGAGTYTATINGTIVTVVGTAAPMLNMHYVMTNSTVMEKGYVRDYKFIKNGVTLFDVPDMYTGVNLVTDSQFFTAIAGGPVTFQMIPALQDNSADADGRTITHAQDGHQAIPGTYFSLPAGAEIEAAANNVTLNDYYTETPNIIHAGAIAAYEVGKQYYDYNHRQDLIIIQSDTVTLTAPQNLTIRQLVGNWIDTIVANFLSINNHFSEANKTYYADWLQIILGQTYVDSAATGYYYTTFGPEGQNRTKASFFIMLFQDGDLAAGKVFSKAVGATLRHNVGGAIAAQNNTPAHTYDAAKPYWIVSATDWLTLLTGMAVNVGCNLTREIPSLIYTNVITINFGDRIDSDITNYVYKPNFIYSMSFGKYIHGIIPNIALASNAINISGTDSLISGIALTTFRPTFTNISFVNCGITTAQINALFHNLNLYFTDHPPTANLNLYVNGFPTGYLTGGAANADLVNLQAIFTAAGKTLTPLYNTDPGAMAEATIVLTFDDFQEITCQRFIALEQETGVIPTAYGTTNYITNGYSYASPHEFWGSIVTWAEIEEWFARGWDIQCHGSAHGVTSPTAEANILAANAAWEAHGHSDPEHLAWPSGSYSDAAIAEIGTLRKTGRTVDLGFNGVNTPLMKLKCYILDDAYYQPETDLKKLKAAIDVAVEGKYMFCWLVHNLPMTADGVSIPYDDLREVLLYAQSKGVVFKTMKQWYEDSFI